MVFAQVSSITGSKILRILKAHGLAPEIPEDMYHMIKKISCLSCAWGRGVKTAQNCRSAALPLLLY
jgi:type III secretion system FlhB-like substrate exporter